MSNPVAVFDLTIDPRKLSKSEVTTIRTAMAIGGVVAVILGVMILVWPGATLNVIAVLFGLYFLVGGIARIVRGIAMAGGSAGVRVLNILLGVLLLVAGIVAIRNPIGSLAVLGMVIGISWLIEGVAALVETASDSSRWFGILFAVISIVAGIVVLLSPVNSLGVLVVVGGVFLIVSGLVQLVMSFTLGRGAQTTVTD
ncbi:DUF308 domain-containing protein [Cryobacterium breve]|uniref:DUF308 domain-containing protein n=1 Tax=Cryobacterium breve TaxID=1259258 RepID=A0ABY7NE91_9MICO|nr:MULTISPECIES: DUF308 domain-containing protein [Cryobacterium]MDY7543888.1 DUF308 domain-containing protein [Cryobacterium sp. 5B3]MEA9997619.1 DUF308 domain-containing protein [Cryobacterium sp. RTS3]MEB0264475.1 DUF308 domain-containing protein [Cryobacterium sp. 10I5]MEB0273600.1 DUF308 domain-containing protein [Cryobacterium sp. 5B3]WBM80337.1 DUF308 domain-containing protein [Cryobacterium breve]